MGSTLVSDCFNAVWGFVANTFFCFCSTEASPIPRAETRREQVTVPTSNDCRILARNVYGGLYGLLILDKERPSRPDISHVMLLNGTLEVGMEFTGGLATLYNIQRT